jgi:uncharacterized protein (DUF488 family)
MTRLFTIGYEATSVASFLEVLERTGVELVVDVRAIAGSRRPGFSKTRLAAALGEAGIEYLHLRGLGTPAEGRAAARAGRHEEMKAIFGEHLGTPEAQMDLATLAQVVPSRRTCLLCLESHPEHCHRSLVASAVAESVPLEIVHLHPENPES